VFVRRISSCHRMWVEMNKKEQRPLPSQSDPCIVGASKVEVISLRLRASDRCSREWMVMRMLLGLESSGPFSTHGPYPWSLSFICQECAAVLRRIQ
jgi:hypothetical protein